MTITRLASAGRKHAGRMAAAGVALASVAALAVAGIAERAAVAASFTVLGHLHWLWIPAGLLLEFASMTAFAIMLRRLLAAGGASIGIRPMLANAYAANAVSVSVPLAGPALATAFSFRRFTRQGADAPLAGWSLLAGGVISSAAAALIVVGGGLASGNILVTAVTVPVGALAVAILVAGVVALRPPGATVPWHDLLLVYGSGIAAQSLNITPGGLGVAEGSLSLALIATGLGTRQALAAVLLYRLASFWLVALAGWLVVFWLRHPRARRDPGRTTREQDTATAADTPATYRLAGLGPHELVLLHGQPGSAADWQLVAGRLPTPLHAVAADRPGYGSSWLPPGGF